MLSADAELEAAAAELGAAPAAAAALGRLLPLLLPLLLRLLRPFAVMYERSQAGFSPFAFVCPLLRDAVGGFGGSDW